MLLFHSSWGSKYYIPINAVRSFLSQQLCSEIIAYLCIIQNYTDYFVTVYLPIMPNNHTVFSVLLPICVVKSYHRMSSLEDSVQCPRRDQPIS